MAARAKRVSVALEAEQVSSTVLKNKPLVEAILEVKWSLSGDAPGLATDPYYRLLLGRLSDRVSGDYPEYERLPTAALPDDMMGHVAQHRFRSGPNDWPLLQIGPGILTLNDTQKYVWGDFRRRSVDAVTKLFQSHPSPSELEIASLMLRYIDAIDFDFAAQDIFEFLKDKMNVAIALPKALFSESPIHEEPTTFVWQSSFACQAPSSVVTLRFASGQRNDRPALLWETIVQSTSSSLPAMPREFETWVDQAHKVTHDWFFKLIEGELERRFRGD